MNRTAAREVLAALEAFGVRYVVFGGAALNLHGLARFTEDQAVRVPFDDIVVNVASPRTLYRMKRDTVRPKDWSDAAALKRHFAIEDD